MFSSKLSWRGLSGEATDGFEEVTLLAGQRYCFNDLGGVTVGRKQHGTVSETPLPVQLVQKDRKNSSDERASASATALRQ